ncbi:FAD-dependent monooxygenase [Micromonospora sp. WMMD882]|uniref:FAD-dependent monooxygenase n=1 Tax=Micromonospora sp. WMMD882 TaxID=3015151 RepID=UPI00248BCE3A|nr:FAD-dependent monooxygenase [Micromonospora sp. WMMD882]WBB81894.1 FAD-dependent monooxygenase [Micromonospora sp. WMMD882]
MRSRQVEVLVVGGSTVGLFAALFLARHGVSTLCVDRHPAPLRHPRAMGIGPRTVELLREAGIADAVDAVCMDMSGSNLQMFSSRTLAEADLAALSAAAPPRTRDVDHVTPQHLRGTCPQSRLDTVVLTAAREHGASVEFDTELTSFTQDDAGVTAVLTGPAGPTTVRARYLVAADGARSAVRSRLGVGVTGPGPLGRPVISVLFESDLAAITGGHTFIVCDVTHPDAPGGLLPVDGDRQWIYHFYHDPATEPVEAFTPARCRELIRTAVGQADLPVEVVSVLPWQAQATVADRFRVGRVLLAGDAAHVVPPVGAFGMNTGVADSHNLAWKLALVLADRAGEELLDTYEAERRPVALAVREQAMLRLADPGLHWARGAEGAARRAAAGAVNAPVVHLGYRYDSAAVVNPQPTPPSTEDVGRALDGAPGSRLPHGWLAPAGRRVSSLDLVAGRFTLFTGADGTAWWAAAAEAAHWFPVGLQAYRVGPGREVADPDGWTTTVGIGDHGALLVRPDGFVAWRATTADPDPAGALRDALAALLHGTPTPGGARVGPPKPDAARGGPPTPGAGRGTSTLSAGRAGTR